ncbi:MAG: class I SAM-dependent methyltransferase [Gammaproteobacteria bacterium]|nr:class I SAM-dependent methyltransferase [Gammaproteobacteria bacterium]
MSHLYKSTAKFYANFRPAYPLDLVKILNQDKLLDMQGRLLDIGCGTGQLALLLSPYYKEVIAVDPEAEMLEQAQLMAKKQGSNNVAWLHSFAEQIPDSIGLFNLITIGRALHWMDGKVVLPWVQAHLQPKGALAVIGEKMSFWEGQETWKMAAIQVVNRYLGDQRLKAKSDYIGKDKQEYTTLLSQHDFSEISETEIIDNRTWTIEKIKGFLYSTASSSQEKLGSKLADFEHDIDQALLKINPEGTFFEQAILSVLIAKP